MARCLAIGIAVFVFEDDLWSYEAYGYWISQTEVKCEEGKMAFLMVPSAFFDYYA